MELRTLDGFQAHLTEELKWREVELSTWERTVLNAREHEKSGLLRGGAALLYAHWEGYVKESCRAYLEFVSLKGLKLGELTPALMAVAMRKVLGTGEQSKNSKEHIQIIEMVLSAQAQDAKIPTVQATIRTYSNLNFERFLDIMDSVGCDGSRHEIYRFQINRLLRQRNEIAHGRYEEINLKEWSEIHSRVTDILRDVRSQLGNAAAQGSYRK